MTCLLVGRLALTYMLSSDCVIKFAEEFENYSSHIGGGGESL